jgi:hypothetical protein
MFSFLCMQLAQVVSFTNHTCLMTFDVLSSESCFEAAIIVKKQVVVPRAEEIWCLGL